MLCPVYGHELTPLSCPPSGGQFSFVLGVNYTFALHFINL